MHILLTGANGIAGGFIARAARAAGHRVTTLGRRGADVPFDLAAPPEILPAADALVHAAFSHLPGRYRGGEGDDPEGFLRLNRDGSLALFDAARRAGISRIAFLSSRAVYGPQPSGTPLREEMPLAPDTLYGQMKAEVEAALPDGLSLRATGIYGGETPGKWAELFAQAEAGDPVAPRIATEVHGDDLAAAILLGLEENAQGALNLSDLLLDRHALLAAWATTTGRKVCVPDPAPLPGPAIMDCTRARALGWTPVGWPRLTETLRNWAKRPN